MVDPQYKVKLEENPEIHIPIPTFESAREANLIVISGTAGTTISGASGPRFLPSGNILVYRAG